MSTYASPPKLFSYVDHWPHSASDLKTQVQLKNHLGPVSNSYVDHWPEGGDGPVQTTRTVVNSYVDHFPKAGDLYQSNLAGSWPGTHPGSPSRPGGGGAEAAGPSFTGSVTFVPIISNASPATDFGSGGASPTFEISQGGTTLALWNNPMQIWWGESTPNTPNGPSPASITATVQAGIPVTVTALCAPNQGAQVVQIKNLDTGEVVAGTSLTWDASGWTAGATININVELIVA